MFLKNCESCGIEIKAKLKSKRFCSRSCLLKKYFEYPDKKKARSEYNKRYLSKPENKKRLKQWKENYLQKPEVKERNRIFAVTRYRERRKKYWEEYGKRPEVRSRINTNDRKRRKIDGKYAIIGRLRRSLNHAMNKYSKTGKIMSSKKYGINWKEVIGQLKPFPEDLNEFEIDHIIPLHLFDLNDSEQIKKAFAPDNLQWLTISENRIKGGK
ncbi:hypothetical protein ES703_66571 [subsurface metagenome]